MTPATALFVGWVACGCAPRDLSAEREAANRTIEAIRAALPSMRRVVLDRSAHGDTLQFIAYLDGNDLRHLERVWILSSGLHSHDRISFEHDSLVGLDTKFTSVWRSGVHTYAYSYALRFDPRGRLVYGRKKPADAAWTRWYWHMLASDIRQAIAREDSLAAIRAPH